LVSCTSEMNRKYTAAARIVKNTYLNMVAPEPVTRFKI
jgi:hypothetical protein